ncbi:uncharacterized protein METZ01_LOCUS195521, partial [marine metagenome]
MAISENDVLWDFGVVIKKIGVHNNTGSGFHPFSDKQNNFSTNINAVIADPFIPPVKNTYLSLPNDQLANQKKANSIDVVTEENVKQVLHLANKYYLQNNYQSIIDILRYTNYNKLTNLNCGNLKYLLAIAYYQTGAYNRAHNIAISSFKKNESDRLCLLL